MLLRKSLQSLMHVQMHRHLASCSGPIARRHPLNPDAADKDPSRGIEKGSTMSVRQPPVRPHGEPAQSPPHREVSLRVLACLIVAAALGVAAWRFSSNEHPRAYRRRNQRGYLPRHRVA